MAKTIKNYGRSVKERLLNISRAEKYSSQLLISRYFQERLLYRLSVSDYKDKFILKGGALLYAHDGFQARPTLDIDFMAKNVSNDMSNIKKNFFDVYQILSKQTLDSATLSEAIKATFANRGTDYKESHPLFSEDFFTDSIRSLYWKGFLKRIKYSKQLSFTDVGALIRTHLQPYWDQLRSEYACSMASSRVELGESKTRTKQEQEWN